jgi:hypothetical protein
MESKTPDRSHRLWLHRRLHKVRQLTYLQRGVSLRDLVRTEQLVGDNRGHNDKKMLADPKGATVSLKAVSSHLVNVA